MDRLQRTDDPQLRALAGTEGDGEEIVLRRQRIAHVGTAQRRAGDGPLRIGGQDVVEIDGLMGAVEGADAKMNDAGGGPARIIGRPADGLGQGREGRQRQSLHRAHLNSDGSHSDTAGT